jgi:Leucine-rich repeat (LRR) protein
MRHLDLSHNQIESVENLQFCYELEYLDLGFNQIAHMEDSVPLFISFHYVFDDS